MRRVEAFLKCWLTELLQCEWMWYRVEFQSRNSSHIHGTAKIGDDPGLLDKTAELYAKRKAGHPDSDALEEEICSLMDKYVSAMNLNSDFHFDPVKECTGFRPTPPDPHPCSLPFENSEQHYADVFNSVQRHFCYSEYCVRDGTCRFGFPMDVENKSRITFEELENGGGVKVHFIPRRNDPRANLHNKEQLLFWRGNVDFQFILDEERAIKYMAKYTTKAESRSKTVHDLFQKVINADEDQSPQKLLRSLMIKSLGERDIGMMETCHLLLNENLYHSDFKYKKIWLDSSISVRVDDDSIKGNIIDDYAKRSAESMSLSLDEFVTRKINDANTIVRWLPKPRFVRDEMFWKTAKNLLMRFKPWIQTPESMLPEISDENITIESKWVSAYEDFFQNEDPEVERFQSDIDRLRRIRAEIEEENEEEKIIAETITGDEVHIEEWVELMNTVNYESEDISIPGDLGLITNDQSVDWFQSYREFGHLLPAKIGKFFESESAEEEETSTNSSQSSTSISTSSILSPQSSQIQLTPEQINCISSHEQISIAFKEKCDGNSNIVKWLNLNKSTSTFLVINLDHSKCRMCGKNRMCSTHRISLKDLLNVEFEFENSISDFFCNSGTTLVFENVLDQQSLLEAIDLRLRSITGVNLPYGDIKLILLTPLNSCQFKAVQRICHMVYSRQGLSDDESQHIQVLLGEPGTGKSFVIQSLKKIFQGRGDILIAASTGSAAANLESGASTLHSLAMIPVDSTHRTIENPSAKCLRKLQDRFQNAELVIIDEFSMIGKNMMGKLDIRLRQATGKQSMLGGLCVLFCGDPQQLPPVGDTVLYQRSSETDSALKLRGSCIYDVMTKSPIILDEIMRQEDPRLMELLKNCASGKLSVQDWRLLQTRNPDRVPNWESEFKDAVRLYQDKESVRKFNFEKIATLGAPIARIRAEHTGKKMQRVHLRMWHSGFSQSSIFQSDLG
jgi:hypothetical protein